MIHAEAADVIEMLEAWAREDLFDPSIPFTFAYREYLSILLFTANYPLPCGDCGDATTGSV